MKLFKLILYVKVKYLKYFIFFLIILILGVTYFVLLKKKIINLFSYKLKFVFFLNYILYICSIYRVKTMHNVQSTLYTYVISLIYIIS